MILVLPFLRLTFRSDLLWMGLAGTGGSGWKPRNADTGVNTVFSRDSAVAVDIAVAVCCPRSRYKCPKHNLKAAEKVYTVSFDHCAVVVRAYSLNSTWQ